MYYRIVVLLVPGLTGGTFGLIIGNLFKPTNIYQLLATRKEQGESRRTISIGAIEFEQTKSNCNGSL